MDKIEQITSMSKESIEEEDVESCILMNGQLIAFGIINKKEASIELSKNPDCAMYSWPQFAYQIIYSNLEDGIVKYKLFTRFHPAYKTFMKVCKKHNLEGKCSFKKEKEDV